MKSDWFEAEYKIGRVSYLRYYYQADSMVDAIVWGDKIQRRNKISAGATVRRLSYAQYSEYVQTGRINRGNAQLERVPRNQQY